MAEALSAFPTMVRFRKSESPIVTSRSRPITQRTWDVRVAPKNWITSVPKKGGIRRVSDPQRSSTIPLMTDADAMVAIM